MSEVNWIIKNKDVSDETVLSLMGDLGCGYLLASVLCARGITNATEAKKITEHSEIWHDPMMLPDIALAVNRIKNAKARGELVAVYGDYDADGITATVIMQSCLEEYGLKVIKYIPSRSDEGYGLNTVAIDRLKSEGVSLIVTVDCGISSKADIDYAKGIGIDTIVTDHHNCPEELPSCIAVVNPKRKDSLYPCRFLAGAGVAYKFACALLGLEASENFLEFAAIGTVADVVEIQDENRKIVNEGLKIINSTPSCGVEALLMAASKTEADSTTLAFIIGPRINCAGRMESPEPAYKLLKSANIEEAAGFAEQLNQLNRERQKSEQEIYEEAISEIKRRSLHNDKVIIVGGTNWNPGVIGIAAAKITEKAYKPCILIAYDKNGEGRASGRSTEGFNLYEALKNCESLLTKYGGHSQAAGLSILRENEEEFRSMMNKYADNVMTKDSEIRKVMIDALVTPEVITVNGIRELSLLEPFGTGNEKPVFAIADAKIADMRELSEGKHLKLVLRKKDCNIDAIAFGYGPLAKKLYKGMSVHISGNIEINDYTGNPQIIVKDILYK
ncbi:MAG: single-stranded-DNA-specific exonuclease RecJ [Clostridia bacterium]|nr:single-stranded-DNA-specific exonuclease RecJ [Clostridia bacterium]